MELNVVISERQAINVIRLIDKATSMEILIRKALAVTSLVTEVLAEGGDIIVRNKDGSEEKLPDIWDC